MYIQNADQGKLISSHLLYGFWYIGIDESEEQIPEGPALSAQHCSPRSSCMSQRQVYGQQLHTQQHKLVMFPRKERRRETIEV